MAGDSPSTAASAPSSGPSAGPRSAPPPGPPSGPSPRRSSALAPGSTASLRLANQRRVLASLLSRGSRPMTQTELSRETGLAAATVSNIVRELAGRGLVTTVRGAGRRGTAVQVGRSAGLAAGVDFAHDSVSVALGDMAGRILGERHEPLPHDLPHEQGLQRGRDLLDELLDEAGAPRSELRGVGLGLPAPITGGVVLSAAILPAWVGIDAEEAAAEVLGATVHIDNDANLGALAEHRRGRGRGHRDVVFVRASAGLGAGLVLDGRVFRGTGGTAGELGHLTVDDQGPLCRCGSRGCLETYVKTGTVLEMMRPHLPDASLADIVEAAHAGNVAAARLFEDAGLHLGWGLAAMVNLLNPSVVLVGGEMSRAGELFLEPARRALRRHVVAGAEDTPVEAAGLGDRACVIGALLLAVEATDLLPENG